LVRAARQDGHPKKMQTALDAAQIVFVNPAKRVDKGSDDRRKLRKSGFQCRKYNKISSA
jgi:hypothetical protein